MNFYISDTWEPPTPPQLQFLPRPTNAWRDSFPKSITSTTASKADVKKTKTVNSTREVEDQQTITTAATQLSYSQDAINNLQSESRKHSLSIKIHSERFNCIEELVQTQIQQINTTVDAICNEQQSQIQQQWHLASQIESLSETLPMITETLQLQLDQHTNYIAQLDSVNDTTSQVLERIQTIQHEQPQTLSQLRTISQETTNVTTYNDNTQQTEPTATIQQTITWLNPQSSLWRYSSK
jgi:chromosome segregation ATPase